MILYTVEPYDAIFPSDVPESDVMSVSGGYLETVKGENGKTVRRLFSTNPADYLNKKFSPGADII